MLVTIHRQYHCSGCFWCGGSIRASYTPGVVKPGAKTAFTMFPSLFCSESCAALAFEYYRKETFEHAREKTRWG